MLALAMGASAGAAEVPPSPVKPPAGASAPTPYRSPFEAYRVHHDVAVKPWRESNDLVGRLGGWKAYASEPPASAQPPQRPPNDAKAGHAHEGRAK